MKNFSILLRLLAVIIIGIGATTLQAQPANNECAGAISTTMNPNGSCAATTSVVTTGATISNPTIVSGTFCANASGDDDVWYTFTTGASQTGVVLTFSNIVALTGTANGAGYAVYSGTCAGLTQLACVASAVTTTASVSGLTASTTYYLRTWIGGSPNSGTFTLCLQVPPTPPNCATNLMPATGSMPTLICSPNPSSIVFTWTAPATGPVPTGYKFYLGTGTPALLGTVAGTTATIFNLLPSTAYNWYVVPTNGGDAVGCNTPLTFTTGPEPACVVNNSCAAATAIGSGGSAGSVNSTTTGATISQAAEVCAAATGVADDDVWFKFTTDSDGGDVALALTAPATALDAVIIVYSGTCAALTSVGCADATVGGQTETATLLGLAANTTYYARVYGFGAFSAAAPTSGAFTLATSGTGVAAPLPIALSSFNAQAEGVNNMVHWATAQEHNSAYMVIERGNDQTHFTAISDKIAAQGEKSSVTNYAWMDSRPLVGNNYYRLRSVDLDGQEAVSDVVLVTRKGDHFGITSVFPSPTTDNVTVQFVSMAEESVTVRVMDLTGRVVLLQSVDAAKNLNELPITLNSLQSGVYTVTVANSTSVSAPVRFVKE